MTTSWDAWDPLPLCSTCQLSVERHHSPPVQGNLLPGDRLDHCHHLRRMSRCLKGDFFLQKRLLPLPLARAVHWQQQHEATAHPPWHQQVGLLFSSFMIHLKTLVNSHLISYSKVVFEFNHQQQHCRPEQSFQVPASASAALASA